MRKLLPLLAVLLLLSPPLADCKVVELDVTPQKPVVGDTVTLEIQASPGEEVTLSLHYSGSAPVEGGRYEVKLKGLQVPATPNSFTARATGVENLRVTVNWPIPITLNKDAVGGKVTLSHSNIPPHRYDVKVWGNALPGYGEVDIEIDATVTLTMDAGGRYTYSYGTGGVPPGTLRLSAGGMVKTLTLREETPVFGGSMVPPIADFTVEGSMTAGKPVYFDAGASSTPSGTITSYMWSFGDGHQGNGPSATHIYDAPGVYQVTLTITNNYGLEASKSIKVAIAEPPNQPPQVSIGGGRSCLPNQVLVFRSHSTDPDGQITGYQWSFGDGANASTPVAEHSWSSPGLYRVTHTVVDDQGAAASTQIWVRVEEPRGEVVHSQVLQLDGILDQWLQDAGVAVKAQGNGTHIYLLRYAENPVEAPLPLGQVGPIVDLVVSDPGAVSWPLYLELWYGQGLVVGEEWLGVFYYDGEEWAPCSETGVYPERGVAWANLSQSELAGSPLTTGVLPKNPYFQLQGPWILDEAVYEGEPFNTVYQISNEGKASGNALTILYIDEEAVASRTVHLNPGESTNITVRAPPLSRGDHTIRVGGNNLEFTVQPPLTPNLRATLEPPSEPGEAEALVYRVVNLGNRTAGGFTCSLLLDGVKVAETWVDSLAEGEAVSWSYPLEGLPSRVEAVFTVDVTGVVEEAEEGDNVSYLVVGEEAPPPTFRVYYLLAGLGVVLGLLIVLRRVIEVEILWD